MLDDALYARIGNYCRFKLDSLFDPGLMFTEDTQFETDCQYDHKGLYVGVVDSSGNSILREGFLQDSQFNIKNSLDIIIKNLFNSAKQNNISREKLQTSTFHYSIINDCIYKADPLNWDENSDGVYFMWGQRFRAMYLPYEIKKLGLSKVDVLDRLCSFEAKVPSSLWRSPEGLIYQIKCVSFSV